MGDWLKIYYYGRIKQSKAKQLFASRNFHYSLLLFTIWYLCDYSFYEGERLLHDEANMMQQRQQQQMLRSGVLLVLLRV